MTGPVTAEALAEARELVRQSLKGGAPGLTEATREAVVGSIMLKLTNKVLAPLLAAHQQVTAERDAYALVLSDCAATLEQVPVSLLPGRVDMMLVSALSAPLPSGESREAVIAAADRIKAGVTAERDEARDLAYELKLAAAGGEDVPGSANLVTPEDVRRWRDEDARQLATVTSELARLRAEGEAKDRALKPFASLASSWVVQTAAQRDELLTLSNGERMCGIKATAFIDADTALARAATAREGA